MKAIKTCIALLITPAVLGLMSMPGCSTAPPTQNAKADLSDSSHTALDEMKRSDPSLQDFMGRGYAWVVFPSVGKGGAGIGGAYGRGEVYEQGQFIGYADVSQATLGVQIGGETYSELLIFDSKSALQDFESNKLTFAADASAVAIKEGAAAHAGFSNGVAVFTKMNGGLMLEAAIGGQQFTFQSTQSS